MYMGNPEFNIKPQQLPKTSQQIVNERNKELKIKSFAPHKSRVRCFINCAECSKRRCVFSKLALLPEEKKTFKESNRKYEICLWLKNCSRSFFLLGSIPQVDDC
jgi:hypothetical protein